MGKLAQLNFQRNVSFCKIYLVTVKISATLEVQKSALTKFEFEYAFSFATILTKQT
jgi:hypothetical protein